MAPAALYAHLFIVRAGWAGSGHRLRLLAEILACINLFWLARMYAMDDTELTREWLRIHISHLLLFEPPRARFAPLEPVDELLCVTIKLIFSELAMWISLARGTPGISSW